MEAPDRLYRVFDNSSMSIYSRFRGFPAQDTEFPRTALETARSMWEPIRRHLDWHNRYPTPFVSTWDCSEKAWSTAKEREARGRQNVGIAVIDVDVLTELDVWFARLIDLVKDFNVYLPDTTKRYLSPHEYVCFHSIPRRAVMRVVTNWEDFEEYRYTEGGM